MKHTQGELQLKSGNELDELVATAQGWIAEESTMCWHHKGYGYKCPIDRYHPTQNTTEGKAQAWDLMLRCHLSVNLYHTDAIVADAYCVKVYEDDPQRAVVIAAILSFQENVYEQS